MAAKIRRWWLRIVFFLAGLRLHGLLPETFTQPVTPRLRLPATPRRAGAAGDALGRELLQICASVSLTKKEEGSRAALLEEVRKVVGAKLGSSEGIEVLPFGSSANGCGERTSDVDACIKVPESLLREAFGHDLELSELRGNVLKKLQKAAKGIQGWKTRQFIPGARIPLLILNIKGVEFDFSSNELPVYNTRLLRAYVELSDIVRPLAIGVKRVAKKAGVVGASQGWVSSYSWTLMLLYYLQRRGLLPSLQLLAKEAGDPEQYFITEKGGINVAFCSVEEARQRWKPSVEGSASVGELFRGFFEFYAREYEYGDEVVSVRLGRRATLSENPQLFNMRQDLTTKYKQLHIEDPFEVYRNLNFPLSKWRTAVLQQGCADAAEALKVTSSFSSFVMPIPAKQMRDPPFERDHDTGSGSRAKQRPDGQTSRSANSSQGTATGVGKGKGGGKGNAGDGRPSQASASDSSIEESLKAASRAESKGTVADAGSSLPLPLPPPPPYPPDA